jgi:DNA excision repair protein ERCC-2
MAVRLNLDQRTITLSVGDLVAEPQAAGRVGGLSQWTRLAIGRETHATHQRAQAGQNADYAREVAVRYKTTIDDFAVTIQGRIDGVVPGNPTVIEEIKSAVLPPLLFASLTPEQHPSYVEQLRLYCYFLRQADYPDAVGRLIFINAADNTTRSFELPGPFDDVAGIITDRIRLLIGQARDHQARITARRDIAGHLGFPHPAPRRHQDEMIAAVERALANGRHLLVNAPSGTGKTAGALFPVVKEALAKGRRVFFVTAKNTQQAIALETLRRLDEPTVTQFRAREKMCINSVYACREEFCPHLQMFAPKLQHTGILPRLLEQKRVTADALMEAGRGCSLCPFELALIAAEQTDVILCDYNYVFDPQVYFRRFFQEADYSDNVLIIDEAHNLLQRAQDYYSPVLTRRQIHEVSRNLSHVEPGLARDLRKFLRALDDLFYGLARDRGDEYSQLAPEDEPAAPKHEHKSVIDSPRAHFDDLKPAFQKLTMRYLLDKVTGGRAIPDDPVEDFFGAFGQFCSVLAMEGDEFSYVYDSSPRAALQIVCKDPSRRLADRIGGFHSVIAMSATLSPLDFYRQMLGFDEKRTDTLSLPSPFDPAHRRIIIAPHVLTTFHARAAHYDKIADIIAVTASAHAGNYMALFPSYDFLRQVAARLENLTCRLLVQEPGMNEAQRLALLEELRSPTPPKLVLGVQGGLFAEGVDLAGDQLIGVIVVSPALPQVSFERELMRQYYQQEYGKGFDYAYLYPGMSRVIQSVGRLIRTETDRGVAVLVCQRFKQTSYQELFPRDWGDSLVEVRNPAGLEMELRKFWD